MASKIAISYQGLIATDAFCVIHFAVGNGSWMRHQTVKVPWDDILSDEVTQKIDRHVRRRMIEVWSDTPLPDLWDEARTAQG